MTSLRRTMILCCRRRTLALTVTMTSVCLVFYGQVLPRSSSGSPRIPVLSAERRKLSLEEVQISKQISSELKSQEDELMVKVKNIESETLEWQPWHQQYQDQNEDDKKIRKSPPIPKASPKKLDLPPPPPPPLKGEPKKVVLPQQKEEPKKEGLPAPPPPPPSKEEPKKEQPLAPKGPVEVPPKNLSETKTKVEDEVKVVKLYPEKIQNSTIKYPPHLHPDRFKFIYKKERLSKEGPKVNPIPEETTWLHELEQANLCNTTDPLILAIIVSAVTKRDLRNYIRRTWANPRLYPYTKIRSVFVIGATPNAALQEEVDKEYSKYSDIIQYNHIDSYETLTYKSMAWLKWVGKYCPQAKFIAKIDDDVMVNPFHLRAYFEDKLKNPPVPQGRGASKIQQANDSQTEENIATTYIYGRYDGVPYPMRYSKWGVTKEEYPEGDYPPFVHGPAYVVGSSAARLLLEYAPFVPFLKLEDVYTTGLLAHAAQVKHVQINGEINTFKASSKLYNGTQALMEETNSKSRQEAWEGIALYAPVDIKALGTPWT